MLYWLVRPIVHGIFWVFFGFRSFGMEHVPKRGGAILASNHQSFLDPMLLGLGLLRRVRFVARTTLFRNPVFGFFIREVGAMSIDRDAADLGALRSIAGFLRAGHLLVMFPEGTRPELERTATASSSPVKPSFGVNRIFH